MNLWKRHVLNFEILKFEKSFRHIDTRARRYLRHPPAAIAIMSDGNSNKSYAGGEKVPVPKHKRNRTEGKHTVVNSELASKPAAASSTDTQDETKDRFRKYAELVNTLSLE